MSTEEIAPSEWRLFGASFSDRHRGWLVSATRRAPHGAEQRLFNDAALERVVIDTESEPQRLYCLAREDGPGSVRSVVSDAPRRVLALYADDGGDLGLRVETADGGITELRFRVAARPETVDGVTARGPRAIVGK